MLSLPKQAESSPTLLLALTGWEILRRLTSVPTVVGRERVWLQYGNWRPPYAIVQLPEAKYVGKGQRWDVGIELTVPVNDNNLQLGNFMVSLALLDGAGGNLVNVSRPAILSYPSSPSVFASLHPLRLARSLFHLSARCTASTRGSLAVATLHIPLLESTLLRGFAPPGGNRWASKAVAEAVGIEVGRRDAHDQSGSSRELQVYECWLVIETRLRGLRSVVHRHPYISFAVFFPTFLFLECIAALSIYVVYVLRPPPSSSITAAEAVKAVSSGESGYTTTATSTSEAISGMTVKQEGISESEEDDVKPLLSPRLAHLPSLSSSDDFATSASTETETETELGAEEAAAQARARRLRLGKGGVGMSEVAGEGEEAAEETDYTEEEEESEFASEEAAGEGLVRAEEEELEEAAGEQEEVGGKWEEGTVGGSETTASSLRSFGPSLAGTSASSATTASRATGVSGAGLRERVIREEGEEEKEE
ncbi:hypothetical protein JCM11641_005601 [Rhodosporidiobolus odoratus]